MKENISNLTNSASSITRAEFAKAAEQISDIKVKNRILSIFDNVCGMDSVLDEKELSQINDAVKDLAGKDEKLSKKEAKGFMAKLIHSNAKFKGEEILAFLKTLSSIGKKSAEAQEQKEVKAAQPEENQASEIAEKIEDENGTTYVFKNGSKSVYANVEGFDEPKLVSGTTDKGSKFTVEYVDGEPVYKFEKEASKQQEVKLQKAPKAPSTHEYVNKGKENEYEIHRAVGEDGKLQVSRYSNSHATVKVDPKGDMKVSAIEGKTFMETMEAFGIKDGTPEAERFKQANPRAYERGYFLVTDGNESNNVYIPGDIADKVNPEKLLVDPVVEFNKYLSHQKDKK